MTREEIKNTLVIVDFMLDRSVVEDSRMILRKRLEELCELAIKALDQQPCEDTISRSEALSVFKPRGITEEAWKECDVYKKLTALPSVQPQPKTGNWYIDERPESDREVICSNCEQSIFKYHKLDFDYRPNYCPNCGAKM